MRTIPPCLKWCCEMSSTDIQESHEVLQRQLWQGNTEQALVSFLLTYHTTPHSTTNETPSKLFLGHKMRTRLDLLLPNQDKIVFEHQAQQKRTYDKHSVPRELLEGAAVMAKNNDVLAKVKKILGPLTYLIETASGQIWRRHIDHLKCLSHASSPQANEDEQPIYFPDNEMTTQATNDSDLAENTNAEQTASRHYPLRESR